MKRNVREKGAHHEEQYLLVVAEAFLLDGVTEGVDPHHALLGRNSQSLEPVPLGQRGVCPGAHILRHAYCTRRPGAPCHDRWEAGESAVEAGAETEREEAFQAA